MAIFHLNVVAHSRAKGHSAVNGAAYRAAVRLVDDRTGLVHDYSKKGGAAGSFIVLPQGVEPMSRQALWDAVEAAEKRKNSTVAREIEISLPHELAAPEREKLAVGFTDWLVKKYGLAAEVSLHNPTKKNDAKNFHAHIYTSTRALTPSGFAEKIRVLDAAKTGSAEILAWRAEWATRVNAALAANNIISTIDHRSHAARGLSDLPTQHEGNGPQAARIKAENADIKELNEINENLKMLLKERAELAAQETIQEATRQAQADVAEIMAAPTLAQLEIERQQAIADAREAAKTFVKAKADRERASPRRLVAEAQAALPAALEKLDAAKAEFKTREAKGVPWYAPWRQSALERAQEAYNSAKTAAHELRIEARAPILEEVERAARQAEKQLATAQAERERIELQMLQDGGKTPVNSTICIDFLRKSFRGKNAYPPSLEQPDGFQV